MVFDTQVARTVLSNCLCEDRSDKGENCTVRVLQSRNPYNTSQTQQRLFGGNRL